MTNTLKCWIISNLEILASICFFILIINSENSIDNNQVILQTQKDYSSLFLILIGLTLITIIFFSVKVAIYTYKNFSEVVSRRMLWRNSNVSLFNEQLKYSIGRFIASFIFFVFIILDLAIIILK